MPIPVTCLQCGKAENVQPARAKRYKFCSYSCRGSWRKINWSGANCPLYQEGVREKVCHHCSKPFFHEKGSTYATFKKQKFCSKPCADEGGFRYSGPEHKSWTGNPRRRHRNSKQASWARKVISRDLASCRQCGTSGVELQAHHIKPYQTHPELRWELDNGLTLCAPCHWQEHAKLVENRVNCWNPRPDLKESEGNQQPSFGRKPIEGSTTSGRAYRRWDGSCDHCGCFISKRWSDTVGKSHLFCGKVCAGRYNAAHRTYRPMKSTSNGSNAATSALHPLSRVMI